MTESAAAMDIPPLPPRAPGAGRRRWLVVATASAGLLALVLAGLIALGVAMKLTLITPDRVLASDEVPDSFRDILIAEELIEPGEKIVLFYPQGFAVAEAGVLLTDHRLID